MTSPTDTAAQCSAAAARRAIGAMFFGALGGAWLVLGILGAYGPRLAFLLPVVAATIALFVASLRKFQKNRAAHAAAADSQESKKAGRVFSIVNAVQWALVFIVALVLSILGHKEWIIPAIIFIVGMHFLPLAVAFKNPRHYATGAAMMLLAVIYPFVAKFGPASPIGCLGSGIILWASAVAALVRPA